MTDQYEDFDEENIEEEGDTDEMRMPYDFFVTADYEAFGYITKEGYPVEPMLLRNEDLYFIYQLALMDKPSREEVITSIQGLQPEPGTEVPDKPRIQLLH